MGIIKSGLIFFLVSVFLFIILVPIIVTAQKVAFDETRPYNNVELISETGWYGASSFANALQNNGFNVSKISDKPISYDLLKEYDVLIIISSYEDYSNSEINAIENFVKNGGGLLIAVNHWQGVEDFGCNRIAKKFGVSFGSNVELHIGGEYDLTSRLLISNLKPNEISKNISNFYFIHGTYIKEVGFSNVLARTSNDSWLRRLHPWWYMEWTSKDPDVITGSFPVLSEMIYGKGRIVFIGSKSVFENDHLYFHSDNGKLGLNIISWLANSSNAPVFIPPSIRLYTPSSIPYRIVGIIMTTLLLFVGLLLKIRKEQRREKPIIGKPIENWMVTLLIIGYIGTLLWSCLLLFLSLDRIQSKVLQYTPYIGTMGILTSFLFCLFTVMILFGIFSKKKLQFKYAIINIYICLLLFLGDVFFQDIDNNSYHVLSNIFQGFILFSVPLSIPNIISLRIIRTYGQELRIKEKKLKTPPTPLSKPLPKELTQYFPEEELFGEGDFAWIYKATRKDGKKVAIEIPKSFDESTSKNLVKELSHWSNLEHENIVKLYDFNIYPIPYLELELCDGILECQKSKMDRAVTLIIQIAKGLRYAHNNKIIHGNIKPSNIFIKNGKAMISDWCLSEVARKTSMSLSGFSPEYAAPEQISMEFGRADERTDIYQLGGVFYWLATGRPPFEGEVSRIYESILNDQPKMPSEINTKSKKIEHIIMKCLKKKKEERYQSINELLEELEVYKHIDETLTLKDENTP